MKTDRIRQIMQEISKAAQEEKEETANAINEVLDKPGSSIALAIQMLSRRPDISISTLIRSASLYKNNNIMDEKNNRAIVIGIGCSLPECSFGQGRFPWRDRGGDIQYHPYLQCNLRDLCLGLWIQRISEARREVKTKEKKK